ncbi:MAG: Gfo/Idh/MocA family oxidoreductase [Prevotella sp.]|nr:Gfo/Idh/MocA family oxidoreductase [Prevotella sp.]MBP3827044.1 Gfo/Idh/MocA family oxidoreductase [Prevotella sp.]
MIQTLINRYKRMRTERFLRQTYQYSYAFVGMGQHSLTNLYPVLHYLGVPLKYICVTSERKVRLIERKFPGVKATTSLDEFLNDEAIKGVFVSASPSAHFSLASQVLRSGKSLFIEKPPCRTLRELDTLIDLQRLYGSPVAMIGLQKRFAPAVQLLKKRLNKERLINYDLHYITGAYPEGDALLDLFIHPLDLICHLFGQPEILVCQHLSDGSYLLMLRHPQIVGTLELSTSYSWSAAEESLKVCTRSGLYRLTKMEELIFTPLPSTIANIPIEKLRPHDKSVEYLYQCNSFTPILANNPIYSQGYFNELAVFVDSVEHDNGYTASSLETIKDTYRLMDRLEKD